MRNRLAWVLQGVILVTLAGCATMPEVQRADTLVSQGKRVEALNTLLPILNSAPPGRQDRRIVVRVEKLRALISADAIGAARAAMTGDPTLQGASLAAEILNEKLPYDTTDGLIQKEFSAVQKTVKALMQQLDERMIGAEAAAKALKWSEAHRLLADARRINPLDGKIEKKIGDLIAARNGNYVKIIRDAVAGEKEDVASAKLADFKGEIPAPEESILKPLAIEVERLVEKTVAVGVVQLMKEHKYFAASKLIARSKVPNPALVSEIAKKGGAYYLEKAKGEKDAEGRLGYAFFDSIKASMLDPRAPGVFELARDLSDSFDREITINIAISGFDSPAKAPDAGPQFSDALIAFLVDSLPYGIRILERSKIDKMLAEKGRDLKDLSDAVKAEMLIVGNVSILDVEHQRSEQEVTEILQTGTRQESNPEYQQMVVTYGPNVRAWPRIPPPTIATPVKELMKYKKGQERVKGLMVVAPRIFETTKGCITVAKEYKASTANESTFCDAVPVANIQAKFVDNPTDNDIKEELRKNLVAKVADTVVKAYEKREKRFLERAEWYASRREMDSAVRELACGYLFCIKDMDNIQGKKENPDYQRICQLGLLDYTE